MRIQCELEGFTECYLEVADRWTRGEIRRFWGSTVGADEDGSLLRDKTTAVHLVTADGMIIDEPDELIDEVLDGLPFELFIWLTTAYGNVVSDLQSLTKKNVSQSFITKEATK